jgi:hypothetical protein
VEPEPCAECEVEPVVIYHSYGDRWQVSCKICFAVVFRPTRDKAIDTWNRSQRAKRGWHTRVWREERGD